MFGFGRSWNRRLTFLRRRVCLLLFKSRFACLFRQQGALSSFFRLSDLVLSVCYLFVAEEEVRRSLKVILSPELKLFLFLSLKLFLVLSIWVLRSSGLPFFDWNACACLRSVYPLRDSRRSKSCPGFCKTISIIFLISGQRMKGMHRIEWDPLGIRKILPVCRFICLLFDL